MNLCLKSIIHITEFDMRGSGLFHLYIGFWFLEARIGRPDVWIFPCSTSPDSAGWVCCDGLSSDGRTGGTGLTAFWGSTGSWASVAAEEPEVTDVSEFFGRLPRAGRDPSTASGRKYAGLQELQWYVSVRSSPDLNFPIRTVTWDLLGLWRIS